MPKRVLDGEALWGSSKIAALPPFAKAEFANLVPLALANGVFECDARQIWARVYSFNRPEFTLAQVEKLLNELEKVGLLGRWRDKNGKNWGYWIGIHKQGRLPPSSRIERKHEVCGPDPPKPMAKRWLANGYVGSGSGSGSGSGLGIGSGSGSGSSGARSDRSSQDHAALPSEASSAAIEKPEETAGASPSPSEVQKAIGKAAKQLRLNSSKGGGLRAHIEAGIYRKKIEAVYFDATQGGIAPTECILQAVNEAALSLSGNRSVELKGLTHQKLAELAWAKIAPGAEAINLMKNFEVRSKQIVAIATRCVTDAAMEFLAARKDA
jgi:hypothetical protein